MFLLLLFCCNWIELNGTLIKRKYTCFHICYLIQIVGEIIFTDNVFVFVFFFWLKKENTSVLLVRQSTIRNKHYIAKINEIRRLYLLEFSAMLYVPVSPETQVRILGLEHSNIWISVSTSVSTVCYYRSNYQ